VASGRSCTSSTPILEPVAGSPAGVTAGPVDVSVVWSHVGRIVITEALVDPVGEDLEQEWVELHNPSLSAVDIGGWTLRSDVQSHTLASLTVPAGGTAVLCRNATTATVTCDGSYGDVELLDFGMALVLEDAAGREVDRAALTAPVPSGMTLALQHPGFNNARRYAWSPSTGTPGAPNDDVAP